MVNEHIVYDNSATRYDLLVTKLNNFNSDYVGKYLVSWVNCGEVFTVTDLNRIFDLVVDYEYGVTDAININNALATVFNDVEHIDLEEYFRSKNNAI